MKDFTNKQRITDFLLSLPKNVRRFSLGSKENLYFSFKNFLNGLDMTCHEYDQAIRRFCDWVRY